MSQSPEVIVIFPEVTGQQIKQMYFRARLVNFVVMGHDQNFIILNEQDITIFHCPFSSGLPKQN